MFDAHRHFSNAAAEANALYATSLKHEWERLSTLSGPALGGCGQFLEKEIDTISDLYTYLKQHPDAVISEVGLDRRWAVPAQKQTAFLSEVLEMGWYLNRSVTLHVVRSDKALLDLVNHHGNRLPPLLWHGFVGSMETALQASKKGIIISYAPSLYKANLSAHAKELANVRFALESDFHEAEEEAYQSFLQDHLQRFSQLTGLSEEHLMRNNDEIRTILENKPVAR